MPVSRIPFNPQGNALSLRIDFRGLVAASYTYTLWETDSNEWVEQKKGNNQNTQDDYYTLPVPVAQNAGRLIDIHSTLLGLYEQADEGDYQVIITVFQGDDRIARLVQPVSPKPIGNQSATHQFYALLQPTP